MPTDLNMDKRLVGLDSVNEQKDRIQVGMGIYNNEQIFSLERVAAFKPEPMMTSVADNLKRVEFGIQPGGMKFANW